MIYDDLGDQGRPFLRPGMFEEFYRPVYQTLIDTAHDLGCDMHLHCCGKIDPLIPAFIDWGLDALQLDSPRMIGYSDLEPFRGKIMFWGCVDIQQFYRDGTPEQCEREVWHMVRNLGTPTGGYGAYFYPQTYHLGIPQENIDAFEGGLEKYGVYANIPGAWWAAPTPRWRNSQVPDPPN
jgi:uroporphyrinogen decarboxylase